MTTRNKKRKKIDLSDVPDLKKTKILKEIRRKLQERILQEKLLCSLLKVETLTINGNVIYDTSDPLKGFTLSSNY